MALKLDVLANTRQFIGEMKKAGASTEDITDALDELQRQGQKGGEKLERSFRDIVTEAKKADKAVEKIGDTSGSGFKKAGAASGEFKQEALSNFSEVTSSFDGSMSSIQDLAQGTLGGLASSGLPGVGVAAGIAAIGIGAIGTAISSAGEISDATREKVNANFESMAENGISSFSSVEEYNRRLQDAYAENEQSIQRIADTAGLPFETVAAAWAGNKDAIDSVNGAYAEMYTELRNTVGVGYEAAQTQINTWKQVKKPLDETITSYDLAQEKATRFLEQIDVEAKKASESAKKTAEDLAKSMTGLPPVKISVDTSALTNARQQITDLQARANRGINIAFNNTGRNLMG